MALTFPRWILAALAACGVIWFGTLYRSAWPRAAAREAAPMRSYAYRGSPARALEGRVAQVNDRWRELELRDSLLAAARTTHDSTLVVLVDTHLEPQVRATIEAGIRRHWAALRIAPSRKTVVGVVVDTAREPHALPRSRGGTFGMPIDVFLPSDDTNGACVAMIRVSTLGAPQLVRINNRFLVSDETSDAVLSPCAFYAAFGDPSPTMFQWLFDQRWGPARLAAWNQTPDPWRLPPRDTRFAPSPMEPRDRQEALRALVTPAGVACIAGESGACRRMLFGRASSAVDSAWRSRVVTSYGSSYFSFYFLPQQTPLGPNVGWILSDMARTLGPDRFERVWRSPLPVPDAFKQASGEDIDDWIRAWARRMYGTVDVIPTISNTGLIAGVLVIAAAFAGAVLIERKRRVV